MSAGQYLLGTALLVLTAGSLGATAWSLRRRFLPSWSGAPARLAEVVIALSMLVVLAEVIGAAGLFTRAAFALGSVVVGCAGIVVLLGFRPRPGGWRAPWSGLPGGGERLVAPDPGLLPVLAALAVVALVLLPWVQQTLGSLRGGIPGYDSVWYHLPFAARFVQTASVAGIQNVGNPSTSFFPANSELIHAVGMLVYQRDLLSPVLNLGWLGFALLAGWCIGRPWGVGPATMAATALLVGVSVMAGTQPGSAENDIVGLALLLAAVALVVNAPRLPAAQVIAALAAGLAIGTRLNLWAAVIPLAVIVTVRMGRGARWGTAARWVAGLGVGGGFWYGRNLVATGSPFPWFGLKLDGLLRLRSTSAPVDCGRQTVAHYFTHPAYVTAHLVPQLPDALGARWWLVVGLAFAGIAAGLASASSVRVRMLAILAALSVVAYVFTPASAGGAHASCFAYNTRFAVPGLALAVIALSLVLARRGVHPLVAVMAYLITLLAVVRISFSASAVLVTAVLVLATAAVALGGVRRLPRSARAVVLVLIGVAVVAGGWKKQRDYLSTRYQQSALSEPVEPISRALAHVRDARIAEAGFQEVYPLYGADLSDRVELPASRVDGTRFVPYATCPSWLAALRRGGYQYVVTARQGTQEPAVARWTLRYPEARELLRSPPGTTRRGSPWRWELFRLLPVRGLHPAAACRGRSGRARR
jgi:hypothetical protein